MFILIISMLLAMFFMTLEYLFNLILFMAELLFESKFLQLQHHGQPELHRPEAALLAAARTQQQWVSLLAAGSSTNLSLPRVQSSAHRGHTQPLRRRLLSRSASSSLSAPKTFLSAVRFRNLLAVCCLASKYKLACLHI